MAWSTLFITDLRLPRIFLTWLTFAQNTCPLPSSPAEILPVLQGSAQSLLSHEASPNCLGETWVVLRQGHHRVWHISLSEQLPNYVLFVYAQWRNATCDPISIFTIPASDIVPSVYWVSNKSFIKLVDVQKKRRVVNKELERLSVPLVEG